MGRRAALKQVAALGLSAAAVGVVAGCEGSGDDNSETGSLMGVIGPYPGTSLYDRIAGGGDGSVHYSVFNHIGAPGANVYEKLDAVIRALDGDPQTESLWKLATRLQKKAGRIA